MHNGNTRKRRERRKQKKSLKLDQLRFSKINDRHQTTSPGSSEINHSRLIPTDLHNRVRHITSKLQKMKNKEKILNSSQREKHLICQDKNYSQLLHRGHASKRVESNIKVLKEKCQLGILYPEKLSFRSEGENSPGYIH